MHAPNREVNIRSGHEKAPRAVLTTLALIKWRIRGEIITTPFTSPGTVMYAEPDLIPRQMVSISDNNIPERNNPFHRSVKSRTKNPPLKFAIEFYNEPGLSYRGL